MLKSVLKLKHQAQSVHQVKFQAISVHKKPVIKLLHTKLLHTKIKLEHLLDNKLFKMVLFQLDLQLTVLVSLITITMLFLLQLKKPLEEVNKLLLKNN